MGNFSFPFIIPAIFFKTSTSRTSLIASVQNIYLKLLPSKPVYPLASFTPVFDILRWITPLLCDINILVIAVIRLPLFPTFTGYLTIKQVLILRIIMLRGIIRSPCSLVKIDDVFHASDFFYNIKYHQQGYLK